MKRIVLTLGLFLSGAAHAQNARDHLTTCATVANDAACQVSRQQFREQFPKAYRGDYQSQRNVAFCLRNGCDGSVSNNPTLACAWRMVILLSGSSRVDGTDQGAFKIDCGRLDAAAMETAKAQATVIQAKIGQRGR
ncbi:hypothetical protein [Methylobacterium iners]|uniref:Uncharacterized protein n=1 Tax=Methylobacterium iners TaxID=418707 RepID=A0ABQ4RV48_9HYPH|nr:hypothetical protein [Methylobacterium iners]GJD93405.1 hypothetical protein OCOJLMKI_0599 [Methylobacterium iners]